MPGLLGSLPIGLDPSVAPTMSSREIAELVESRHDNVRRTIGRRSGLKSRRALSAKRRARTPRGFVTTPTSEPAITRLPICRPG